MLKHTLGRWHRSQTEVIADADNSSGYVSIAMINVRLEESNENASLIAAAPELLEVCEALGAFTRELLKLVTHEQIRDAKLQRRMLKVNDQAFNVLAKARGEEQP